MNRKICVVGSCNIDLSSYVKQFPKVGETIHGEGFRIDYGGKGANQAVMASKLGGEVSFIGKCGTDYFGTMIKQNLQSYSIDIGYLCTTDHVYTGVANIIVDEEGNNSIIVTKGANGLLTEEEIEKARSIIASSSILLCQLEIPLRSVQKALQIAREEGVTTILNPAPVHKKLPRDFYPLTDVICPNEHETEY